MSRERSLHISPRNSEATGKSVHAHHGRGVSLALGGGGARGISHLGVIQAIVERGFKLDHVCGVSIGAIAGALSAVDPDIERVQAKALDFINSPSFRHHQRKMFGVTPAQGYRTGPTGLLRRFKKIITAHQRVTRAMRGVAIMPESVLRHVVDTLLPDIGIEELPIPFGVVAVDLLSGQRVVLRHGSLRDAVRASSSIPGVFPAVPWDGMLLCDIGVFETVPTITAKEHALDLTVAVDVSDHIVPIDRCKSILEVFNRMQHLAEFELRHHSLANADLIVRPAIERRAWFDFATPEELISLGYQAAVSALATTNSRCQAPTPSPNAISVKASSQLTS